MRKRPTIKDVARQAGLSLSTVSLVINNSGNVSEETRNKVLRVVKELGYHPSRTAKGLASKTSGNIGLILTGDHFFQAEPFYTKIFLGTEFEARQHNYYILLTTVGKDFNPKDSVPRFLLEGNVDGVIIAGRVNEKLISYIENLHIPVILIDYELRRKRVPAVLADNRRGAQLAVSHLLSCGHRSIAFIGGDLDHPSIAERFAAYRETLIENGITPDDTLIVTEEMDTGIQNGFNAARTILNRGGMATALFAANDAMAIGCLQYLRQIGVRVPHDIGLVGFDDIEMSSHVEPRLTTVRVFKEEMGKIAVQRLVDMINSKTQTVVTMHVPVELVVRESTVGGSQEQSAAVIGAVDVLA